MDIAIRRHTIILAAIIMLMVIAAGVALFSTGADSTPIPPVIIAGDEDAEILRTVEYLAIAFGEGELYREPKNYPITSSLADSIVKFPGRAETWPEFVGLRGGVIIILQGSDLYGRAFADVITHVVSEGVEGNNLTLLNLRLVKDAGLWKASQLFTVPKGGIP